MARVTLDAVAKTYRGGVRAVHGVDVDIADGEFIVIVGPSGCGKSTLLRMVAGLETITGGRLLIDGREMNRLEPAERDIAMVFQNYALYPHMSVYDNMAYGLRNRRVPRAEIDSKVLAAADTLGLADLLKRKPRQLSGGQRQRVAMGRAIVREPKVFLFDEPLSNLDAKLRVTMRVEIKRLQRQLGVTALYVTHDQVEAMTLADRLLVMNAGRVEQIGAPSEVYARPATTFVAGFMGNPPMNLLPARSPAAQALVDDRPEDGFIGVRPEHLGLAPGGPVRGHVELAEALGAETILHIRVGDERVVLRGHEAPEEGAEVALAAAPGSVARFDAEGRRL